MIDQRWHVASLCAVFLALGLGVLVGLALGAGGWEEKREMAVQRLEEEFADLRRQGEALRRELEVARGEREAQASALERLLPALLAGRLASEQVILVGPTGFEGVDRQVAALEERLRWSGAGTFRLSLAGLAHPPTESQWRRLAAAAGGAWGSTSGARGAGEGISAADESERQGLLARAVREAAGELAQGEALPAVAVEGGGEDGAEGPEGGWLPLLSREGLWRWEGPVPERPSAALFVLGAPLPDAWYSTVEGAIGVWRGAGWHLAALAPEDPAGPAERAAARFEELGIPVLRGWERPVGALAISLWFEGKGEALR